MMSQSKFIYEGLGFPVILVGFKTTKIRGEVLPDVNFKDLQAMVFSALISKPGRFTGSELLFVRSYLGLTQLQLSKQVGLANHSRVSQWEKKGLKATGMDYPAELSIRLMMAAAIEDNLISKVYKKLSKNRIKDDAAPIELNKVVA
jgi:DNA-binding XRE family transcriptional regulator